MAAHSWQCSSRSFSCIDCSARFSRDSYSGHSQCVSEAEKYQGKLYKGKKHQPQQQQHSAPLAGQKRAAQGGTEEADDDSDVKQASNKKSKQQQQTAAEEETKEQSKEHSLAEVLPSLLTEVGPTLSPSLTYPHTDRQTYTQLTLPHEPPGTDTAIRSLLPLCTALTDPAHCALCAGSRAACDGSC